MRGYCEHCEAPREGRIVCRQEAYPVCGEKVEVRAQVLICPVCGSEIFCEELDEQTLLEAYGIYRRRHHLLFPEQMRAIRQQYGLSQRSFARLLGWSDRTIRRYENGAIQDPAHNALLGLLQDPAQMRRFLQQGHARLEGPEQERLLQRLEQLERCEAQSFGERLLSGISLEREPSINNGGRVFSYRRFAAMVTYLAAKPGELLQVKLMKLLNYADMLFYREQGVSISGLSYVHLPYGPVPEHYGSLFDALQADGIAHIEVSFSGDYEKHRVVADRELSGVLGEAELRMLDRVWERFADYGSARISEYSHRERGYRETAQGQVIPYSYAGDITLE